MQFLTKPLAPEQARIVLPRAEPWLRDLASMLRERSPLVVTPTLDGKHFSVEHKTQKLMLLLYEWCGPSFSFDTWFVQDSEAGST